MLVQRRIIGGSSVDDGPGYACRWLGLVAIRRRRCDVCIQRWRQMQLDVERFKHGQEMSFLRVHFDDVFADEICAQDSQVKVVFC